jgi:hypothetical protein
VTAARDDHVTNRDGTTEVPPARLLPPTGLDLPPEPRNWDVIDWLARYRETLRRWGYRVVVVLLCVWGLIAISLFLTPRYNGPNYGKAVRNQIKVLELAIEAYRQAHCEPPESLEVLLQPDPNNEGRPYFKEQKALIDPWGRVFGYTVDDDGEPIVYCRSPDGRLFSNVPPPLPVAQAPARVP